MADLVIVRRSGFDTGRQRFTVYGICEESRPQRTVAKPSRPPLPSCPVAGGICCMRPPGDDGAHRRRKCSDAVVPWGCVRSSKSKGRHGPHTHAIESVFPSA